MIMTEKTRIGVIYKVTTSGMILVTKSAVIILYARRTSHIVIAGTRVVKLRIRTNIPEN